MISRLLSLVDEGDQDDVDDQDGVLWTSRNTCRRCGAWIQDVDDAPTARDTVDPIHSIVGGVPLATLCSERCRRDFVDARDGWGGAADD